MTSVIPLVDLATQQHEISEEVRSGLEKVFGENSFIGGEAVREFETAYAEFLGAEFCIGVANGTDALELALRASGVCAGGEVILPANTFIATVESVHRIGAHPILVDVDPVHLLIDADKVESAITPRTQAIVPVHLFGQTAFVEELRLIIAGRDISIVEDAAQAQGAIRNGQCAGTLGSAAGTSFYPGKNLGAAGDAGGVVTNDSDIAARIRLLSSHGSTEKYQHEVLGMNSRLDTIQAVVLNAKLSKLAGWNQKRRLAASRYSDLLAGDSELHLPCEAVGNIDVWHLYVVRSAKRDLLLTNLLEEGIESGIHYPVPVHLSPACRHLGYAHGSFPIAEAAAAQILSLPLYPHITESQQERVAEVVLKSVHANAQTRAEV